MASFTDEVVNFTPYRPENPVEAMLSVGMTKQQEYKEGLQKVQTYVDTLGGLDISKQEVKEYVQSKMNQLHQNLNNISGDFSDQRLVNQIGGAASKIANDPIVQNGIIATNSIRTGYQKMEAARKEGKSNPNNEIFFTDAVNSWQNDGQLDTKLQAEYTPYFDIVGEVRKVFKDMNPGQDLPKGFGSQNIERDENGNVKFNINYAGTMVNMEGISVDRVQHAVDLVMQNGSAKQQMSIDGYARYRGMDGPQMFNHIKDSTQRQLQTYNDAIAAAQSKLGGSTVGDKTQIIEAIKGWKETAKQIAAQSDNLVKQLGNNVEGVKSQIVESELRTDLVGAFAFQKMVESPLWNANKELERLNLEKQKFIYDQMNDLRNFQLEELKLGIAAEKAKKEKEGTNYVAPLPVSSAEPGSASMYKMKEEALGKAAEADYKALSEYAFLTKQIAPFVFNQQANKWEPNAEGYGGGANGTAAANAAGVRLTIDMKSRRAKGTIPPEAAKVMQEQETAWDEYLSVNKRIVDIENIVKPKMDRIKSQIGTKKDGSQYPNDWYDVVTVRQNLPGKEIADQRLKSKFGDDWQVGFTYGTANSPVKGETKEFAEFQKKVISNKEIVGIKQQIEDKFKGSQMIYQNKATVFDRSKPELQQDVKTAFTAALLDQNLVSPKGDAAKLREAIGEDNKEDQYMAWQEYNQGQPTYWIAVQKGDGKIEKVQITPAAFTQNPKLQQAIPNIEFQKKFGTRLGLRGGRDTFAEDGDVSINGGQISAFPAFMQSGTITYNTTDPNGQPIKAEGLPVVQYHLRQPTDAPGQYQIVLYVTDGKTEKPLIQGEVLSHNGISTFTQEQVLAQIRSLENPTILQGYLDINYKKK